MNLADDPELTVRLPGMAHRSPVRIIFDSRARLPLDSRLVVTARDVPVWLVTGEMVPRHRIEALRSGGVDVLPVPTGPDGRIDPRHAMASLAWKGITSVLVEGGAALGQQLLGLDLVDELAVFRSSVVGGGERIAAPAAVTAILAGDGGRFEWTASHHVGADRLYEFRRRLY